MEIAATECPRLPCERRHVEADCFKGERTTVRVYAMLEREWRAGGRSFTERSAGIR
jgi:hypothetical protein